MLPGPDHGGRLRIDQRLEHRLHGAAHHITAIGGLEHIEKLHQGRLVKGHRVHLLRDDLVGLREDSHDGSATPGSLAASYTTRGDATKPRMLLVAV